MGPNEPKAQLLYKKEVAGMTLAVGPSQIMPLALALAVVPNTPETEALFGAVFEALPASLQPQFTREVVRAERELRKLYRVEVPVAPKTTAKPTIVGKQMTGTSSYIMWVANVDDRSGAFRYSHHRHEAMVFPSRNAAQNAVRRRFEGLSKIGVPASDRFTDFFTEVVTDPNVQQFTTSRFESTSGGSPFAPKVDRTLNRHEEGAPFDEPAPRPTDITDEPARLERMSLPELLKLLHDFHAKD